MAKSYTDYIRSIDAHTPVSSEFRVRTVSGALLSLLTVLFALCLISSEYAYNLTPTFLDHVRVMPQSPDGLEVGFDVTFPHIPCALLATDANDPSGQSQSFRHRVWKHRLDGDGNRIGRKSRFELGGTLTREDLEFLQKAKGLDDESGDGLIAEGRRLADGGGEEEVGDEQECGSCYGAGEEGECCNTCDGVKRAYRRKQWQIDDASEIDQCVEGCDVHGYVALSTGGGNLHFAPDRQMFKDTFEQFNVSHTVNQLSFGPYLSPQTRRSLELTSQLDGAVRSVADGYGMFQYYLQVVPTVYRFLNGTTVETFQYSVTEHTRNISGIDRGFPGVFFFYEVSALHVEFEEYRREWFHFLTGACAAAGGLFAAMGMLDRVLFEWRDGRGRGEAPVR